MPKRKINYTWYKLILSYYSHKILKSSVISRVTLDINLSTYTVSIKCHCILKGQPIVAFQQLSIFVQIIIRIDNILDQQCQKLASGSWQRSSQSIDIWSHDYVVIIYRVLAPKKPCDYQNIYLTNETYTLHYRQWIRGLTKCCILAQQAYTK